MAIPNKCVPGWVRSWVDTVDQDQSRWLRTLSNVFPVLRQLECWRPAVIGRQDFSGSSCELLTSVVIVRLRSDFTMGRGGSRTRVRIAMTSISLVLGFRMAIVGGKCGFTGGDQNPLEYALRLAG